MGEDGKAAVERAARTQVERALALQDELLPLPSTSRGEAVRAARRAGRPVGARNRRSEDVARFVIERIGDPLLVQAMVAVMPAEELAAAGGMSVAEALAEKRLAAGLVLPYLHRRQPLQVDVANHKVVYLTVSTGAAPVLADAASQVVEVVEFQQVTDDDDAAV